MSKQAQLRDSLSSIDVTIDVFLTEEISRPYSSCKDLGNLIWGLVDMFRSRAILRFLLNADVDGFFEDLHREALTYLTLLKAYHQAYDVEKTRVNAYTEGPLACALAAGNFELAREIDALMPTQVEDKAARLMAAYTTMLRKLTTGDEQAISAAFQEFKRNCAGQFRFDDKIAVIDGLVRKDAAAFNEALGKYLDSFQELSSEELSELDPGDDDIDVEGLAYVQLARRGGVHLALRHRMLPPELLEARRRVPQDGYPTWP
jgi:hypothetical protein